MNEEQIWRWEFAWFYHPESSSFLYAQRGSLEGDMDGCLCVEIEEWQIPDDVQQRCLDLALQAAGLLEWE